MHEHTLFALNVFAHLVALMSGIVSFILAIVQEVRKKPHASRIFWIICAVSLLIAFDQAWRDEHHNLDAVTREKAELSSQNNDLRMQIVQKNTEIQYLQKTAQPSRVLPPTECYRPDRRLTDEQKAVLFRELQSLAKDIKKQGKIPTIALGNFVGDIESQNFLTAIRKEFDHSGWTIKPQTAEEYKKRTEWIQRHGYFTGIIVADKHGPNSVGFLIANAFRELGSNELLGACPRNLHFELERAMGI